MCSCLRSLLCCCSCCAKPVAAEVHDSEETQRLVDEPKKGNVSSAIARFEKKNRVDIDSPPKGKGKSKKRANAPMQNVRCSVCRKKVYKTEEVKHRENIYHRACFKCTDCRSVPDDPGTIGGELFCRRCGERRGQQQKAKDSVKGQTAGLKTQVSTEEVGDVQHVMETIGEELEASLEGFIPRQVTCA